jgi:thermolabile hemolysin
MQLILTYRARITLHRTTRTHRILADRVAAFVHLHFPGAAARES